MNGDAFRVEFDKWWHATNDRELAAKNSHGALLQLIKVYEGLTDSERLLLDQLFCEWIESGDEFKRFDALAMVDRFGIRSCMSALQHYQHRLRKATAPDTPYEVAKVEKILKGWKKSE
jgi:hypothetical protein